MDPNAVFDVLVVEAGARESQRAEFVHHFTNWPRLEFRFMGDLGFGGKLWKQTRPRPKLSVSCYQEDKTPERLAIIERTNALLEPLASEQADDHG